MLSVKISLFLFAWFYCLSSVPVLTQLCVHPCNKVGQKLVWQLMEQTNFLTQHNIPLLFCCLLQKGQKATSTFQHSFTTDCNDCKELTAGITKHKKRDFMGIMGFTTIHILNKSTRNTIRNLEKWLLWTSVLCIVADVCWISKRKYHKPFFWKAHKQSTNIHLN